MLFFGPTAVLNAQHCRYRRGFVSRMGTHGMSMVIQPVSSVHATWVAESVLYHMWHQPHAWHGLCELRLVPSITCLWLQNI